MAKLNRALLTLVKQGFVPQPGGGAEPVAGAGQMTAGMAGPMQDPNAAAAGGGGMPMDPSMAGGGMPMPPPGVDPAMMGMVGGGDPNAQGGAAPGNGKSTITLTIDELIKLVKVFSGGAKDGTAPAAAPAAPASDPKVGEIHAMLQSMLGKQ